jgi:lipoate-protein ligase A
MSERWRFLRSEFPEDPALNYAIETSISEHVGTGVVPPTLRLWQPGKCLAVGRFDSKLPNFESAVAAMKEKGVLVLQRMSGGKAVWQDKGYLNFSVIIPRTRIGIPEAYRKYSEGLIRGFRSLGVETDFEHVEGAFCDGPYDLAANGIKLVGTAQVQKKNFIMVHGTILIDCDVRDMVEIVSRFYEIAGEPSHLITETMASLRDLAGREVSMSESIEAIRAGYEETLGAMIEQQISAEELGLAKAKIAERVL